VVAADVTVVVDEQAVLAFKRDPSMGPLLTTVSEPRAARARATAPKRTGAGAASIGNEAVLEADEWTARVGWDQAHFYLLFHEVGTGSMPARPFLVPAFGGR
jgi:HK97 gp10 family phage protein